MAKKASKCEEIEMDLKDEREASEGYKQKSEDPDITITEKVMYEDMAKDEIKHHDNLLFMKKLHTCPK